MKLLILTQAVDLDDPVLGFFHEWIDELAKRFEFVHVICLKEGRHSLSQNVAVRSLGKESGASRIKYIWNFYRYVWRLRREYDAVFVHMNPEYVVLGGLLWRLWRKKIALWYVHKKITWKLRVSVSLCDVAFTASRGSFRLPTKKLRVLSHGIDTDAFMPPARDPKRGSILFLGRLDPVKRVEVFVEALRGLHRDGTPFFAEIVGDPTDPRSEYAHDVRNRAAPLALEGMLTMRPAVTNEQARELFRSHAIFCNLTPSGSFDKTILEAMASGCVCVVANDALKGILPEQLIAADASIEAAANALQAALDLPETERAKVARESREWVERNHSLSNLIEKIYTAIATL